MRILKGLLHWVGCTSLFIATPIVLLGAYHSIFKDVVNPLIGARILVVVFILSVLYIWYLIGKYYFKAIKEI